MKLNTMEKALEIYPNRFQLTMMAVARAREINEGDNPLVESDDLTKPVVAALVEISEDTVLPATHEEMNRIREAKRIIRERALMEAREEDNQPDEEVAAENTSVPEDTSLES
jgi:DNA-directed RNA polymerase subunit omega